MRYDFEIAATKGHMALSDDTIASHVFEAEYSRLDEEKEIYINALLSFHLLKERNVI